MLTGFPDGLISPLMDPARKEFMKAWMAVSLGFSLIVLHPSNASGALIAYEPFLYPAQADPSGQHGGIGWAAPWTATAGDIIVSGSLNYRDDKGNTLMTLGNSVVYNASASNAESYRNLSERRGADNTTTWLSFLGARMGDLGNPPTYYNAANVSLYDDSNERLAVGEATNRPEDTWSLVPRGQSSNTLPTSHPFDQLALLVVRIDHLPGNDNAYLFVNPRLGIMPALDSAAAASIGEFDFSFNRVRPFVRGTGSSGYPPAVLHVDEIRLGETFFDVTPFIPPPSSPVLHFTAENGLLHLSWLPGSETFTLEQSTRLGEPDWLPAAKAPTFSGGVYRVTLTTSQEMLFFRLRWP
jgi:hypothetical protein